MAETYATEMENIIKSTEVQAELVAYLVYLISIHSWPHFYRHVTLHAIGDGTDSEQAAFGFQRQVGKSRDRRRSL